MHRSRPAWLLQLTLLACSVLVFAALPTRAAHLNAPPSILYLPMVMKSYPHRIAFAQIIEKNVEIMSMNPNGSDVQNLTNNPAKDTDPHWSPDRSTIVFVSNRDKADPITEGYDIYTMRADGAQVHRLTVDADNNIQPRWSPDGSKIAFVSERDGNDEIYVMKADGSEQTRLTSSPEIDVDLAWSFNGAKIAFWSTTEPGGLVVMNSDGTNKTWLQVPANSWPIWSPTSMQLAFQSYRDDHGQDVFEISVVNADGSGLRQLTNSRSYKDPYTVVWSPNGAEITFGGERAELYKVDVATGGVTRLSPTDLYVSYVAWSPDGQSVAFIGRQPPQNTVDVYTVSHFGSNLTKITNDGARKGLLEWTR